MSICLYMKHASASDIARFMNEGVNEDELSDLGGAVGEGMDEVVLASLTNTETYLKNLMKAPMDAAQRQQVEAALEQLSRQLDAARAMTGGKTGAMTGGAGAGPASRPGDAPRPPLLDLHKSWHMLHYLFTGQASDGNLPAASLMHGGQEVGEDMGYGPARAMSPEETADFARYLETLDVATLSSRLDIEAMQRQGVYCAADADDEGSLIELEEELEHYFPQLQAFVARAAGKGEGLLMWMS